MTKKPSSRLMKRLEANRLSEKAARGKMLPSPNPVTNLLIADIVVRGASSLFRKGVEKRVAVASLEDEEKADDLLDGRTLIRTLGIYGASRLATRSPIGLGIVAGALGLKTLYDRGKSRQQRRALGAIAKEQPSKRAGAPASSDESEPG